MKLRPLKRKILPSRRLFQRKRINHRLLYTRVLHHGVTDHRQEVESIEEDLLEGIRGHDESVLRLEEGESQDLLEDTIDTRYLEVGVGRGTTVTDHDADYRLLLDVEGLIHEGDRGHREGKEIGEKDRESVVEAAAGQGVDLDDPP